MKLRTKTLVIICIASCILTAVLGVTLGYIVSSGYSGIERQNVASNVGRVLNQLQQEDLNIRSISYDWAVWDDTYSFINNTNQDFIQLNLQYDIFSKIHINFMLFYNNSGALVFAKDLDLKNGSEIQLPDSLFSYITENKNSLLKHPDLNFNQTGILCYDVNETPLLIGIAPILHSNSNGPIQGTLIVGRYLDDDKINTLGNITQLKIVLHPLSNTLLEESNQTSFNIQGKAVYIQPVNSTYIAGFFLADDILGHPVFALEVGSNRYVYNQGIGMTRNLLISLLIIIIVFIVLMILIIDRFVTSRLTYLTNSINDIRESRDLSKKFKAKGNDEIALLENKIDTMLTSLHKAWTLKEVTELSLKKKVDELERFKKITVDRELKMMELKQQLNELRANSERKSE